MKINSILDINEEDMKDKLAEEILSETSFWEHLTLEEKKMVLKQSFVKEFSKNQLINSSDSACMGVVFVLKGEIRVCLISDEGREISLYRVEEGECCVTTASCVVKQITFDTSVSASVETELLVIPPYLVSKLSDTNIYFRAFLFEKETERFSQAIWVIQEILFKRFDQRLAAYLLSVYEKTGNKKLSLTQEQIARDVNSAREVVARMLRHFSSEGLVEVKRGSILLRDIKGLEEIL